MYCMNSSMSLPYAVTVCCESFLSLEIYERNMASQSSS